MAEEAWGKYGNRAKSRRLTRFGAASGLDRFSSDRALGSTTGEARPDYANAITSARQGEVPARPGFDTALDFAVHELARTHPELSARKPIRWWQAALCLTMTTGAAVAYVLLPTLTGQIFAVALSVVFLAIIAVRALALHDFLHDGAEAGQTVPPLPHPRAWPPYAVLVPVYRESLVVPGLVQAMAALDYPSDRLEIHFLTEATDIATRTALYDQPLAANMRVVTVPEGLPRTKPRALNYALAQTRAELIAIYDAEDLPEPEQLKAAARRFAVASDRLACIQAMLVVDRPIQGFLARHFAIEYATLFRAILPILSIFDVRFSCSAPVGMPST